MAQETQANAVEQVREKIDADILESAEEAGVDAESIIQDKVEEHDSYGASTVARFAKTAIESQIEAEEAEELSGIIMGSRDRHGKNWPRRHALLRSSGDHLEVSTWQGALPNASGTEVPIPEGGSIVTMSCDYDSQYESYEGARLESTKDLSAPEVVEEVSKVAGTPGDVGQQDEYEVVAVKGTIQYVDAQTLFENGEPAGDGPVLMRDDRGAAQPHFEFTLEREGGTVVRGHIERQSYGKPFFQVTDLKPLLNDAVDREEPSAQADFLEAGLKGVEVLVVGNVNSWDQNRNEGEVTEYVDIGVTALVSTDAEETETVGDDAEEETEAEEPEDDESEQADADEAPDEDGSDDPESESSASTGEGDDESGDETEAEDVQNDVEMYLSVTGEDPGDVAAETVLEMTNIEASETMVDAALDRLADGEEAPEGNPNPDSDDTLSGIKENGVYHCPGDGCLVQESSKSVLAGHAETVHIDGNDTDPMSWLEERA